MRKDLHKFRHLHIALFACSLLIGIVFKHRDWPEFWAFSLFLVYFCWNVFAFIHDRNMLGIPRMMANVKRNGDEGARQFLFVLSIVLIVLINVLWVWRYSSEILIGTATGNGLFAKLELAKCSAKSCPPVPEHQ